MIWEDLRRIREEKPLVHNITNYVVMNTTANTLLAIGASPVMAHAVEEAAEMAGSARALVINIGTLSAPWVKAMLLAGKEAGRRNIPVILDPAGSGATRYRTLTARRLIREIRPAVIRGNASEIVSLVRSGPGTSGVDSRHTPDEVLEDARSLSRSAGCVVSVSGPVDIIVSGDAIARVANGHPMMTKVTGMGCAASAITGAFLAVNPSPLRAAAHAMALMGIAGEITAERAEGPGSFQARFLDVLYGIRESDIVERVKLVGP
jgi:hydroxyethylthiazole kinase